MLWFDEKSISSLHSSSCFECFDFAGKLVSSSQSEWGVMRRNIYITYTVCLNTYFILHYGKKYKKYFYLEAVHQPLIKKTCIIFNFWPTTVDIYGTRKIEVHFTILFASKITLSSCEWKVMGSSIFVCSFFPALVIGELQYFFFHFSNPALCDCISSCLPKLLIV